MAIKEIIYRENSFTLSYEILNPIATSAILILHGWGSHKELMKQAFAKQLPTLKHLYLDLPGFGKSSNPMILTTDDYAKIIKVFLEQINTEPDIVIGHSFGGKVATLLDAPCLVLLSSSGVLIQKPWKVKLAIKLSKLIKPLGGNRLKKMFRSADVQGMSTQMYETFKNVVDEDFEPYFAICKSKTLCFWGKVDTATPPYTGEKIASLIKNSQFYLLDGDHYFFLHHTPFICDTISQQCKENIL